MLTIGPWIFDPESRRLLAGSEERRLSPKAGAVLSALAETPHRVWSREALLERAWPDVTVGEEVLTHAIAELRRVLDDDARAPRFIETVHKSGYRLLCDAGDVAAADGEGGWWLTDFDLSGYAAYLQGCELFERGGRHNTEDSIRIFSSVIAHDPTFPLAHVGLAKALTFLGTYYVPGGPRLEQALDHCAAARRLDPRSAPALAAEGLVCAIGGNFARALQLFRASIVLQPDSSETHYLLGRACFAELNIGLAAPMLERAAALRPDDYHSPMLAAKARQMLGDEDRARLNFVQALDRTDRRIAACPDDYRALCAKARSLVHLGRASEASAILDDLLGHPDPIAYHLACTFARAGETRRALDALEEIVELGWSHRAWLDRDPDFHAVRDDSRFKRITRAISAD